MKLKSRLEMAEEAVTTAGAAALPPSSSTPEPTPSAEAEIADGESSVEDWGALADAPDNEFPETPVEESEEPAPAAAPAPAPAAAPAPTTPPVGTPPAGTEPPAPAASAELPTAPVVTTPPVVTAPAPEKTSQELEAEAKAAVEARTQDLVKYYDLGEDLAAKVQSEPETVLPVMAAKLHMAIEATILQQLNNHLNQNLPTMITAVQATANAGKAAKESFYAANPDLVAYEAQVLQAGPMWRQLNPKATPDEAIKGIGNMVRMALGLPMSSGAGGNPTPPSTPTAPAAPTSAPATSGFRPAGVGGAAPAVAPQAGNTWAKLADELLQDDS